MTQTKSAALVFILGTALMSATLILGKYFMPEIQSGQAGRFADMRHSAAMLKLLVFAFGFPLGMGLTLFGAALFGGSRGLRSVLFALIALAGPLIMFLIPGLAGTERSPAYFGIGGLSIAVLFLISTWTWGRRRAHLAEQRRTSADLQALGYLCFALAAWNICGVGGMPGFALYPEKSAALDTSFFIIVNLKIAMAFFVLGWLFTAWAGLMAARRAVLR